MTNTDLPQPWMAANEALHAKYRLLLKRLEQLESLAVAFSGGVDSSLLLYAAHSVLGDKCVAYTAASRLIPLRELTLANTFCLDHGIEQVVIERDELLLEGFAQNDSERCYICKRDMMLQLAALAEARKIAHVAEGSNASDLSDFRPGAKAVSELGILSPLQDVGLSKPEIREILAALGLPVSSKPAFACLATRIASGHPITGEALQRIDHCEQFLLDCGLEQLRVRSHGNVARIETDEAGMRLFGDVAFRKSVHEAFEGFGFRYTALDLIGYRIGSMNAERPKHPKQ